MAQTPVNLKVSADKKAIDKTKGDVKKLSKDINKNFTGAFKGSFDYLRKQLFSLKGAVAGLFSLAVFKRSTEYADQITKIARNADETTENMTALAFAIEQSGGSISNLQRLMPFLSKAIVDASKGIGLAKDSLDAMGVSAQDLVDKGLLEILFTIAERWDGIGNATRQVEAASALFGARVGSYIIPLLRNQGAELKKLTKEAREYGIVIDEEFGVESEAFGDLLNRISRQFSVIIGSLVEHINPHLEEFSNWIKENRNEIKGFADGITSLASSLVKLGGTALRDAGNFFTTPEGNLDIINVAGAYFGYKGVTGGLGRWGGGLKDRSKGLYDKSKELKRQRSIARGKAMARGIHLSQYSNQNPFQRQQIRGYLNENRRITQQAKYYGRMGDFLSRIANSIPQILLTLIAIKGGIELLRKDSTDTAPSKIGGVGIGGIGDIDLEDFRVGFARKKVREREDTLAFKAGSFRFGDPLGKSKDFFKSGGLSLLSDAPTYDAPIQGVAEENEVTKSFGLMSEEDMAQYKEQIAEFRRELAEQEEEERKERVKKEEAHQKKMKEVKTRWEKNTVGALADIAEQAHKASAGRSRTAYEAFKALSIAQATVNTYTAISEVWADKSITSHWVKIAESVRLGAMLWGNIRSIHDTEFEGRATGGEVKAGKPYMVGEQGREIMIPETDGYIMNNYDTENLIGNKNMVIEVRGDGLSDAYLNQLSFKLRERARANV